MGTKVQYTSNLSRSYKMRDLNEDAEGSWSQYYEDKASSGNFCNGYPLRPLNGYSEYDKEMLKRTMLEHEAVFRKQVYDLHRLYRTQKNMMAELKNGQYRHLQADTSQSNSFSSQVQSEATASNNRATPTHTVFYQKTAPSNSNYENKMQYCPVFDRKVINLEDDDMTDSKNKGVKRKMFDLELPAEVYIDCEEVERPEKRIVADSSSVTTVPIREDCWKSDLRAQNSLIARGLVDLNEPVKEICFEKGASSASAIFQEMKAPLAESQGIGIPMRSHSSFLGLSSVFHKGRHCDEGTSSRNMHAVEEETSRELPFFPSGSGQSNMKLFSPASSKEKFSAPPSHIELNQKPREILCIDRTKRETWFKSKLEISGGSPLSGSSSHTFLNYNNISSPRIPSWTNLSNNNSHAQFPVPSLQCFKGTPTQRQSNSSNKWEYNAGAYPTAYQNGLNYEGQRPQKDVHLNHTFQNGFLDRNSTQKLNELEGNCGDSSGTISWLRKKPSYNASVLMQLDFSNGYPQLKPTCNVMNPRYELREESEKNINLFNLQNLSSSSQTQGNEAFEGRQEDKKIFGFSIPDQTQSSSALSTHKVQSQKDNGMEKGSSMEIEHPVTEQAKCSTTSSRIYINLNSNPNSPDLSTEGEVLESEVCLQACAPTLAPGIDLEAPISLETEELDDTIIKEAAKCILFILSDKCMQLDSCQSNPVSEVSFNTLHLLASVVSSNTDNIKENSDSGLDLFEQTTLALEETKPEEFWCRDQHGEDQNDDDDDDDQNNNNFASLLFTKPRGRKRRQKRDFQRDILPGLASLSRQEVTEDLQSIGATRRKSTRGRKPKSVTICVEEIKVDQPLTALQVLEKSPSLSEAEVDGKNMLGWGRTTRRCRRQRFPPVTNIAAPLT